MLQHAIQLKYKPWHIWFFGLLQSVGWKFPLCGCQFEKWKGPLKTNAKKGVLSGACKMTLCDSTNYLPVTLGEAGRGFRLQRPFCSFVLSEEIPSRWYSLQRKKQRRVEVKRDHCLKFIHISRCPSDRFTAHDRVYLASFMAHKPVGDLVLLSWSTATTWWPCKSICRATWCNKRSCLLQQNLQRPKKEVCNRNNVYIGHPFAICSK